MTTTDEHLIGWIRSAAERIPVDPTNTPSTPQRELVSTESGSQRPHRMSARLILVAATLAVVATAGIVLTRQDTDTVVAATQSVLNEPVPVPSNAPKPGQALPHVQNPPAWFGPGIPAERAGGYRTGRWTTASVGVGSMPVTNPISISATDGTFQPLENAETLTFDGQVYRMVESNGHRLLATTTSPTLIASGEVDTETLAALLADTAVTDNGKVLAIFLSELPAGYEVRAHPHVQASDVEFRPMLTNEAGDTAINEISDWVNPELSSGHTGADYTQVFVNGQPAWVGSHDFNSFGALSFLAWSPSPGVVFEITTTDANRTIDELIELAEATTVLDANAWQAIHN